MNNVEDSSLMLDNDDEKKTKNAMKWFILIAFDFLCILLILILYALVALYIKPKENGYFCNDSSILYTYHESTISQSVILLFGVLAPILCIFVCEIISFRIFKLKKKEKIEYTELKKTWFFVSIWQTLSLFLMGLIITLFLTELGRRWIGRLAPYFIDICKPNISIFKCDSHSLISTSGNFCTSNYNAVEQARLSFPCPEASYLAFVMLFLIIYIEARLQMLTFRFLKTLTQLIAFVIAYIICISQIDDNRYHSSDVIGGVVLGSLIAIFITYFTGYDIIWQLDKTKFKERFDAILDNSSRKQRFFNFKRNISASSLKTLFRDEK